jgi:hypothetical protein
MHVSEVPRGLACGLRCAECGRSLVARKGLLRVEHLAHYGGGSCPTAGETTLHLVAKQIVLEADAIMLPAAFALGGYRPEPVTAAQTFRYASAREEVVLKSEGLVPDVIVGSGDAELHIEIRVTHACGPEKLAKLRERNLPSMEIDLSRVPRVDSRQAHKEAVLTTAPRKWLFNRKQAKAEARIRAEAERKEEAEREKRLRGYERLAREVAAVWDDGPVAGDSERFVHQAWDAEYGHLVGVPIDGSKCFAVPEDAWQAAFMKNVVLDLAGHHVSADGTLRRLQEFGMLKEPLKLRRKWPPELVACIRKTLPCFRSPLEALEDYASFLAEQGILAKTADGRWFVPELARQKRQRNQQLRERLLPISAALGEEGPGAMSSWMLRDLPGTQVAPVDLVRGGGPEFQELLRDLDYLKPILRPGGPVLTPECFLGLPLGVQADLRRAEEEKRRKEIEEMLRERRRRVAAEFLKEFSGQAESGLGVEPGRAWVQHAIGDLTAGESEDGRFDRGAKVRERLQAELDRECQRVAEALATELRCQEAERRAAAVAELSRDKLERNASRHFKDDGARTRTWLRGWRRDLGASPWDFCRDDATLRRCLGILTGGAPARRR